MKQWKWFVVILFFQSTVWAQFLPTPSDREKQQEQKIDDLTSACVKSAKKDKVCEGLIQFRQLGYDAVEIIKEYIPLGPFEYATLTAINFALTRRVRIRSKSYWSKNWRHVYDYRQLSNEDFFLFSIERSF